MSFLVIKLENLEQASTTQNLIIKKEDVSAIYTEADAIVEDPLTEVGGTLILLLNSSKEFRFKYRLHQTASTSFAMLFAAINTRKTVEVVI
jgi:hypothetical protein